MPPLVLVDGGESIGLKALVNHTAGQNFIIELWSAGPNSNTPGETDVIGDYTLVTGFGYLQKTLTGSSWTVAGTAPTTISYAAQTWTFTGAFGNVYGYLYKQATSGLLVIAEKFTNGPFVIANNGDTITVNPTITMT